MHGTGTFFKFLLQIFWWSPGFHIRQITRNAVKINFWRYGFQSHPLVKRHVLRFWMWYTLNRDMELTAECPGWQWWYYELEGWANLEHEGMRKMQKMTLKNYRKFPIVRSALHMIFEHNGKLYPLHQTKDEAENAASKIGN